MKGKDIIKLAQILSIQAEIEAMKAENHVRAFQGKSPAYGEDAFYQKADQLKQLV